MRDSGLQVRLDPPVEELPVGERQRLEILKALYRGARILILDEPTAVLTPQETEQLFVTLRQLRDARHDDPADHAQAQGDHGAVRRGHGDARRRAWCSTAPSPTPASTRWRRRWSAAACSSAAPMPRQRAERRRAAAAGQRPALARRLGVARLADVSLTLRAGEIVGVAGVSGNGQSELLDALSGLLVPDAGTLQLGGRAFTPARWLDPATARELARRARARRPPPARPGAAVRGLGVGACSATSARPRYGRARLDAAGRDARRHARR